MTPTSHGHRAGEMSANLQKAVDKWNANNAVGAPVNYRRDNGEILPTATRNEAYVLSGHTAVIFLDGVSGCVALDRVSPRP